MSQRLSPRFISLLTKNQVPEMLAPTYAKLKNIDPNEAYGRLASACQYASLLDGLQQNTWAALIELKPDLTPEKIIALIEKKLSKPRRFRAASWRSTEEGAWIAWSVLVDQGANIASGEALDLIETPIGQELVTKGWSFVGRHLAKELTR